MPGRLASAPLFVQLVGLAAVAMLLPAFHAWTRLDYATARIFLYGAILSAALATVLVLATAGRPVRSHPRALLVTLVASFAGLPLVLAVPFHAAAGGPSLSDAWFEMISAFTTTGARIYAVEGGLNTSLELWRALVAWLGGLFMWIAAFAILSPLNLGGFEVQSSAESTGVAWTPGPAAEGADPAHRIRRFALRLAPVYAGLTGLLWLGLVIAGETPVAALAHAMSTLSTSGISPVDGVGNGTSGYVGEVLVFLFFAFALTRLTFFREPGDAAARRLRSDPELRLALVLAGLVTAVLFLRHFLAPPPGAGAAEPGPALAALWGDLFTTVSFLTTTGFESRAWRGAAEWSGLAAPGIALMGLAIVGGGIATTAGGVKLLRIYALVRHGQRELERMVHPNSVGGSGQQERRIRRQGARIAWVVFMLVTISIVLLVSVLAAAGIPFEEALVLSVAALSTTGPLADVAMAAPVRFDTQDDFVQGVLASAMILGRVETLALVALLNPEFWRG